MTSSEPSDDINTIAERIHSETDGVPLFLNAFIQQLLEERLVQLELGLPTGRGSYFGLAQRK